MSNDEVITSDDGQDRAYRLVQCASCKEIGRCTPRSDYYIGVPGFGEKDLICELCTLKVASEGPA